jgi:hypothetical protein
MGGSRCKLLMLKGMCVSGVVLVIAFSRVITACFSNAEVGIVGLLIREGGAGNGKAAGGG